MNSEIAISNPFLYEPIHYNKTTFLISSDEMNQFIFRFIFLFFFMNIHDFNIKDDISYYLTNVMNFFKYKNEKKGGVAISKIPHELNQYIPTIKNLYLKETKSYELNNTINHLWYSNGSYQLQKIIKKFQSHPYFKNLCNKQTNCKIKNIEEMDEIMFSNSQKINNINYYGATSNYKPHHDCEFCKYIFKKTHVYRVLIGLTNNNKYVVTHFPEYNIGKTINYGDMIAFDFDKTLHEVINIDNKQVSPRILLKLHFLVCEEGELSENYLYFIKKFYTGYDRFLRIYTKIGTDPKYLYEFIIGLSCHFMYYPNIEKIICLYFILFYGFIKYINQYSFTLQNNYIIIKKSIQYLFVNYLIICIYYWAYNKKYNF